MGKRLWKVSKINGSQGRFYCGRVSSSRAFGKDKEKGRTEAPVMSIFQGVACSSDEYKCKRVQWCPRSGIRIGAWHNRTKAINHYIRIGWAVLSRSVTCGFWCGLGRCIGRKKLKNNWSFFRSERILINRDGPCPSPHLGMTVICKWQNLGTVPYAYWLETPVDCVKLDSSSWSNFRYEQDVYFYLLMFWSFNVTRFRACVSLIIKTSVLLCLLGKQMQCSCVLPFAKMITVIACVAFWFRNSIKIVSS